MSGLFADRRGGGDRLALRLEKYAGRPDVLVLGLPRGGVLTANGVALALGSPLDVLTVRRLSVPGRPGLSLGASAAGGACALDRKRAEEAGVSPEELDALARAAVREAERLESFYREGLPALDLWGRTAIVVDDGIVTGCRMRAACRTARALGASRVVAAAPVSSVNPGEKLGTSADEIVFTAVMEPFLSVEEAYASFPRVTEREVARIIREGASRAETPRALAGQEVL